MANLFTFKGLQKALPRLYSFLPYYFNAGRAFPPAHVFFEVTYRCNLRCDMCHFLEIIEDTENNKTYKKELTTEQIKQAIQSLPRSTLITFTGGEAFMKADFMDILEYAVKNHKVHIITNGISLSENVVKQLVDLRMRSLFSSGLLYMGVSLEGREEFHDKVTVVPGSYKKTRAGLERLVAQRKRFGGKYPLIHLTCVISSGNVMDLVSLYDYAEELGINVCNFVLQNPATYWHAKDYNQDDHLLKKTPPIDEINPKTLKDQLNLLVAQGKGYSTQLRFSPNYITPEEIVRYYSNKSSYKDYRCYTPWTKMAFSAYGDVFSCPHYRLGSFDNENDASPWNSERSSEFRERIKNEKIFPGCLGCCQSEYIGPEN